MKFKISHKTFYARHQNEISKYLLLDNSLHIINKESIKKFNTSEIKSDLIEIDLNQENNPLFIDTEKQYEFIVLSDVLDYLDNINEFFTSVHNILIPGGKLVVTSLNSKWIVLNKMLEKLNLKEYPSASSYIHFKKINQIVLGLGYEFINAETRQLFPFKLFGLGTLINKILESIFFFGNFGIKSYNIFRKNYSQTVSCSKSIIIPAKNEEKNLPVLLEMIPEIENMDIVLACGKSQDKTLEVALNLKEHFKKLNINVIEQSEDGKANAVWEAVEASNGEIIAILDADISVDPKILPNFFNSIESGNADFVNGSRLIYPMEKGSMRFINKIGNRSFQNLISILIKVPLTDTLCGTKVFKKNLLKKIKLWQKNNKLKDPFGDFDLLFSSAYFNEKIVELPVNYMARIHGETQISRFRDGYTLIVYLIKSFFIFNSSSSIKIQK